MWHRLSRWGSRRPALAVSVVVAIGAVLWLALLPADSSVSSDDGAYAIQAESVAEGSWSVPHFLFDVDPTGLAYPYQNSVVGERGWFPAPGHAVWVRAQAVAWSAVGDVGLHLLPVLGLIGAVLVSGRLALVVGRPHLRWTSAAFAALSPLLYNALQLWAHAVVAAVIGMAMWAAIRCSQRVTPRFAALLLVSSAAAAILRDDGAVFALAVGVVLSASGVAHRRVAEGLLGVSTTATAVAGYVASTRLADHITGPVVRSTAGLGGGGTSRVDSLDSLLRGALQTFITSPDARTSFVLAVCSFGAVILGVRAARGGDDPRTVSVLFVVGAALLGLRTLLVPDEPITGILGAVPLVALVAARPLGAFRSEERRLLAMVIVGAVGIAFTQYDGGGGLNWGGRFVSASLPALAVLIAAGFDHLRRQAPRAQLLTLSVGAVALVAVVASLVTDASIRLRHDRIVGRLADVNVAAPVVTGNPAIARVAWRTYPEVQWLAVPDGDGVDGAQLLRGMLERAGIDEVTLFGVSPRDARVLAGEGAPDDTAHPVEVGLSP